MEGLGKIPYVNGWVVFSLTVVLVFLGVIYVPVFGQFINTIAANMIAPFQGNIIFAGLLVTFLITVVLKVLDAPKPKLGSGQRFASLETKLAKRPGVRDPGALAASIGRKKYGSQRFQSLAVRGGKR